MPAKPFRCDGRHISCFLGLDADNLGLDSGLDLPPYLRGRNAAPIFKGAWVIGVGVAAQKSKLQPESRSCSRTDPANLNQISANRCPNGGFGSSAEKGLKKPS